MAALVFWLVRRKREGKPTLLDPDLFRSKVFRLGISQQMLQQIALGGTMIALPIYLQMVLEYNAMQAGLSLAPLSLSMFAVALLAGKRAGKRRARAASSASGFALLTLGHADPDPDRAPGGLRLVPRGPADDRRGRDWACWCPSSTTTRWRRSPRSASARPPASNSAAGSFGLSFGLAFAGAIMLATLSIAFTTMAEASTVLPPAEQQQVAQALEDDAEVMSNTQLEALLDGQPAGDPGRDHPHQHRREADRPPGRAAGPAPRRPPRARQLVPHDAPAGAEAVRSRRRHGPGIGGVAPP